MVSFNAPFPGISFSESTAAMLKWEEACNRFNKTDPIVGWQAGLSSKEIRQETASTLQAAFHHSIPGGVMFTLPHFQSLEVMSRIVANRLEEQQMLILKKKYCQCSYPKFGCDWRGIED